ncbi:pyridoxamine 5'-phosphate oxidase family protein [Euzebya rosea]|uniref:pyridoxamine 5'-phosphate oxidase family protein n=1 Tax=Euzebya rosea TaxID=2052804 RepID=UPI000D3E855E|nr:PPOX class F420-dependent oxidoreductase [Euzebya rosea]
MSIDHTDPPPGVLAFLAERHLATLTTLRPDGTPHVVPVGFTWDPEGPTVRIITNAASVKARNVGGGGRAVVSQVDGGRWLTVEGRGRVTDDPDDVAEAVRRYTERYRPPRTNPDRVAIEITIDRMMGRAPDDA